ncbi:DoxX family protein [Nocardia gipuzkoensis]|uniref:DoxX family protein n=1 Tax=Nocardia gipuzkoensis TaxID=2749991 RepID=UPI003EE331B7
MLRLAFASVYVVHGYLEHARTGIGGTAEFFSTLGLPVPWVTAVIFTNWGLVFGILIAIGLFTRFPAAAMGALFVLIIATTTWRSSTTCRAPAARAMCSRWRSLSR